MVAAEAATAAVAALLALAARIVWITVRDAFDALVAARNKSLRGEVVLVTGAGHGMGRQVAIDLARIGAKLVLWDLDEAKVRETAETIEKEGGSAVAWHVVDVTDEVAVKETAEKVAKESGEVTVLLNNAGIMQNVPVLQLDSDRIRRTFDVNVLAHFWTIRAFLPNMEKNNRGHIVALASGAGLIGHVNQTDYSASKFAVVGLMEALTEELRLKGSNIKTTTICPVTVNTGMNQNPYTKYNWIMPIVSTEEAARQIVSAIRREEFIVTIPYSILFSLRFARLFPRRVLTEVMDFVEYCRVPNVDETKKNGVNGSNGIKLLN